MSLGSTELRSTTPAATSRTGLALARRIARPYLEIGCLAHLAITAPLTGRPATVALDYTR
jgi:hypothetical protein